MDFEIIDRNIDLGPYIPAEDDDLLICRCEEVTKGEIRKAIHSGFYTITEIRRYLRSGMGLCQGQTCGRLVKQILETEIKNAVDVNSEATARAPMRPIEMDIYGNEVEKNE